MTTLGGTRRAPLLALLAADGVSRAGNAITTVAIVLALSGLAAGPLNPLIDSALFRLIPPDIRARVIGAITAGVAAAMPLGSLVAGIGVDALGLTTTLVLASAAYATAVLSLGFGRRWHGF